MNRSKLFSISLAAAALFAPLMSASDASACGGCFVSQSETTQVSGHRMILSVSPQATTLWDQITYSGAPESFAWVLPISGTVDVGLSSDALFQVLEQRTQVVVQSPTISCPNSCNSNGTSGAGGSGGAGSGGVDVLKEEVVGPYETVQLSASDPAALTDWLTAHSYNIPADIQPVIDQYVSEGSNFLALKLVPGQGVNSMKPIRVTTPGAAPTLPLRMVAAGTGAITPIILWVFGEGRYEAGNFPNFTIGDNEIVWDWDSQSSNYSQVRDLKFEALNGYGWLTESAYPMSSWDISYPLDFGEGLDSYADENGMNAALNRDNDLDALYGNLMPNGDYFFVTRLMGQLTRPALENDLQVGASLDQTIVYNYVQASSTVGTPPECPPDPCGTGGSGGSGGGGAGGGGAGGGNGGSGAESTSGGNGGEGGSGTPGGCNGGSGGCSTTGAPGGTLAMTFLLGLSGLARVLRRRKR